MEELLFLKIIDLWIGLLWGRKKHCGRRYQWKWAQFESRKSTKIKILSGPLICDSQHSFNGRSKKYLSIIFCRFVSVFVIQITFENLNNNYRLRNNFLDATAEWESKVTLAKCLLQFKRLQSSSHSRFHGSRISPQTLHTTHSPRSKRYFCTRIRVDFDSIISSYA